MFDLSLIVAGVVRDLHWSPYICFLVQIGRVFALFAKIYTDIELTLK